MHVSHKNLCRHNVTVYCLMVALLVLCMPGLSAPCKAEKLNDFTAFSFPGNSEINTLDMRGHILVMVFGSIYCKPCVELLPVMNVLHDRYLNTDVRIILLDIDMAVDPALQREFVERQALKDPFINNALHIARNNKVYMLPTSLIVDREGTIVKRLYGFKKINKFESVIKKLRPIITGPKFPKTPENTEALETVNGTEVIETVNGTNTVDSFQKPVHP